jgi:hypothetical protein
MPVTNGSGGQWCRSVAFTPLFFAILMSKKIGELSLRITLHSVNSLHTIDYLAHQARGFGLRSRA